MRRFVVFLAVAAGCAHGPVAPGTVVTRLKKEAIAVAPLVQSPLAKAFLKETEHLPTVNARRLWHDDPKKMDWRAVRYFTDAEYGSLSADQKRGLQPRDADESLYYDERYGTPLAYARPLDLLSLDGVTGKRILDYGFGAIGQLRLLAGLGAEVTGVDHEPMLRAIYSEAGDQGAVGNGKVTVVVGRFPDGAVREKIGARYDLILSKNTLKRGFIHPDQPIPKKHAVDLGTDDESFLRAFFDLLVPGGRMIIYNICPGPAPPGKPFIPWSDGRNPFPRELWEKVGFRVLEFDKDDNTAVRAQAHALGWDTGEEKTDIEHDLFGSYSIVERP
jgi:SAM-dependent methyltransferase